MGASFTPASRRMVRLFLGLCALSMTAEWPVRSTAIAADLVSAAEMRVHPRLVNPGEEIMFTLLGKPAAGTLLQVFPHYLENCDLGRAMASVSPLGWLDGTPSQTLAVRSDEEGQGKASFTPSQPGNYMARWKTPEGSIFRYFAVLGQEYVVYRPFSLSDYPREDFSQVIRNAGIPIDWVTPAPDHPSVPILREYRRVYGDGMLPYLRTDATKPRPEEDYRKLIMQKLEDHRAGGFPFEGLLTIRQPTNACVRAARALGVRVLDAYTPNNPATLGAPTFPFYVSERDFRRTARRKPNAVIANTLDFVASYHFHAPIDWHLIASNNNWQVIHEHMDLAVREQVLNARNSGVHMFATTLVILEDWVSRSLEAHPHFARVVPPTKKEMEGWIVRWFNETAFAEPKKYPVIFARLIDYAGYFRRHFTQMPTRIVSYVTHDPAYDRYWTNEWANGAFAGVISHPIPVFQDLRAFREDRKFPHFGAPLSTECIWYQSQKFHCRFERLSPKPVRYYRLTDTSQLPDGQTMPELDLPDPRMKIATNISRESFEIVFSLSEGKAFRDYMLAVWDIPREFGQASLETNAKECRVLENTDGDLRAILRFDLEQEMETWLRLTAPKP